jgi:hypothetical protein
MSFVFAFFLRSSSSCVRYQPSRISLRSAGKSTRIGLTCQSRKCSYCSVLLTISHMLTIPRFFSTDFDWPLFFIGVNETWLNGRKLLNRSLRPAAMMSYRQMMQERTREFLTQLRTNPKNFRHHVGRSVNRLYIELLLKARQPSG